ncbi:MAG: response regulator [Alphaproteobacteria bacterium]|nr:MAG: response regulator [Alphaproteobacteria bacterium]
MEILKYYNQRRFLEFVPKVKDDLAAWRIVTVALTGHTGHNVMYIAKKITEMFSGREGIVFICNNQEILVLVNTGPESDPEQLGRKIGEKMPQYSCAAEAAGITPEGLFQIQIRLQDLGAEPATEQHAGSPLFNTRLNRKESVILIADDDMFMRSLLKKALDDRATIIEMGDANDVVTAYLDKLPDVVFLDIHMPHGSGMDVLGEILNYDETAYIIILSSDSIKDNVMNAKHTGAQGFLAKPFTQGKILDYFRKCPTVAARESKQAHVQK